MRHVVFAVLALGLVTPAIAQTKTGPAPITQSGPPPQVAPGTSQGTVIVPVGGGNSGPGNTAVVAPTGTGAATITADTAAGGNTGPPERGFPQTGGGGGGDNGGG